MACRRLVEKHLAASKKYLANEKDITEKWTHLAVALVK